MKAYKKEILRSWWNDNLDFLPLGSKYRGLWQKRAVQRLIRGINERKLDIIIAEKVFGYKVEVIEFPDYDSDCDTDIPQLALNIKHFDEQYHETWYEKIELPHYSTDLNDAFQIVDKVHFLITMTQNLSSYEELQKGNEWEVDTYAGELKVFSKTLPKAICLVALKTKGIEYND